MLGNAEDVLTIFSPFFGEIDHAKDDKSSVALEPPAISYGSALTISAAVLCNWSKALSSFFQ